jgi:porin
MTRDFLTGDWNGTRTAWMHNGVELMAAWYNEVYANIHGGARDGAIYYGVGIASFDVHTDAAGLWSHGQLHVTAAMTGGRSLASEFVGSLNSTSYYDNANVDGLKLFEAWYEHGFLNDAIAIRAGMIYPFVQFGALTSSGSFQNSAFQAPSFLGSRRIGEAGTGFATAFVGAPVAVQIRYRPDPDWQLLAQIQDGFVDPSGGFGTWNEHGIHPRLSMDEGAELLFQATYRSQPGERTGISAGTYSAGVQVHTARFFDLRLNTAGQSRALAGGEPKTIAGDFYLYLLGEQTVACWNEGVTSISLFAKFGAGPASVNPVSASLAAGIRVDAPVASRPRDTFGVGIAISDVSDVYAQFLRESGAEAPADETVIEAQYSALAAPWLLIRPCIQWIRKPSGLADAGNALVVGLTTGVSL